MPTSHDGTFSLYIIYRSTALTGAAIISLGEFLWQPGSSTEFTHKQCGRTRILRRPTDHLCSCGDRKRVRVVIRQPIACVPRSLWERLAPSFPFENLTGQNKQRSIMSIRASGCCDQRHPGVCTKHEGRLQHNENVETIQLLDNTCIVRRLQRVKTI